MQFSKRTSDSLDTLNARLLPLMCQRLYNKGMMPLEIIRLTRDILNIIGHGGFYSADILSRRLERLGWEKNIVDNYIFEMLLYYLECEGTYKIDACFEKNSTFYS